MLRMRLLIATATIMMATLFVWNVREAPVAVGVVATVAMAVAATAVVVMVVEEVTREDIEAVMIEGQVVEEAAHPNSNDGPITESL